MSDPWCEQCGRGYADDRWTCPGCSTKLAPAAQADNAEAQVTELRRALADASQALDDAGCQVAASQAHRTALRGLTERSAE